MEYKVELYINSELTGDEIGTPITITMECEFNYTPEQRGDLETEPIMESWELYGFTVKSASDGAGRKVVLPDRVERWLADYCLDNLSKKEVMEIEEAQEKSVREAA